MKQTYKLTKPYSFDGVEVTEVEFDLEMASGMVCVEAKRRMMREVPIAPMVMGTDHDFCAHVLALITKKPVEFYREMPAKDYLELVQTVVNFFTFGA